MRKPNGISEPRLFYTLQDLMVATGMSRNFLYLERQRGKLIFRKAGGRTVILREDVESYLRNLEIAA